MFSPTISVPLMAQLHYVLEDDEFKSIEDGSPLILKFGAGVSIGF